MPSSPSLSSAFAFRTKCFSAISPLGKFFFCSASRINDFALTSATFIDAVADPHPHHADILQRPADFILPQTLYLLAKRHDCFSKRQVEDRRDQEMRTCTQCLGSTRRQPWRAVENDNIERFAHRL